QRGRGLDAESDIEPWRQADGLHAWHAIARRVAWRDRTQKSVADRLEHGPRAPTDRFRSGFHRARLRRFSRRPRDRHRAGAGTLGHRADRAEAALTPPSAAR